MAVSSDPIDSGSFGGSAVAAPASTSSDPIDSGSFGTAPTSSPAITAPIQSSTTPSTASLVASTTAPKSTSNMFSGFMNFAGNALNSVGSAISKATTAPTQAQIQAGPGGGKNAALNTLEFLPSELARSIPGVADLQDDAPTQGAEAPAFYDKVLAPQEAALTKQKTALDAMAKTMDATNQKSVDAYNAVVDAYNSKIDSYKRDFNEYNTVVSSDKANGTTGMQANGGVAQYVTPSEVANTLPGVGVGVAKSLATMPLKATADVWDAGRVFLGQSPNASINVPVLGKVTSDVFDVVDKINNGEDPLQAAIETGSSSIFNVLFAADLAMRVAGPRVVKTAEVQGNFNDIKPGSVATDTGPKTGRLYEAPVATKGIFKVNGRIGAAPLTPEAITTLKAQGVNLGDKFDPNAPTFFRVTGGKGGAYTAQVMQIKPSFMRSAFESMFGKKASPETVPSLLGAATGAAGMSSTELSTIAEKVPPSETVTLHSATVDASEVTGAIRSAVQNAPQMKTPSQMPTTIPPSKPSMAETVTHNVLRLGNGDASRVKEGASVLQSDIRDHLATDGEQMTRIGLQEKLGVDASTAQQLINEAKPEPVLPEKSGQGDPTKIVFEGGGNAMSQDRMVSLNNAKTSLLNAGYSKTETGDILASLADKTRVSLGKPSIRSTDIKEAAFEYSTPKDTAFSKPLNDDEIRATTNYRAENNTDDFVKQYIEKFGNQVGVDEAKELFPEYASDRSTSDLVAKAGNTVSEAVYTHLLDTTQGERNNTVLITAGGTGAGKSTALRSGGIDPKEYPVILDTNLSNANSGIKRINDALDKGFNVDIHYVYAPPEVAYDRVLDRANIMETKNGSGRPVGGQGHIDMHHGSYSALQTIAEHFKDNPRVSIKVYDNSGVEEPKAVENGIDFMKKVSDNRANAQDLHTNLVRQRQEAFEQGRISEKTNAAFDRSDQIRPRKEIAGLPNVTPTGSEGTPGDVLSPLQNRMQPMRGFINPGAIADEAAQRVAQVKEYIEKAERASELTGTVSDAIYSHEGQRKANRQRAIQLLEKYGNQLTATQWEQLYHFDENPDGEKLTKQEETIYKEVIAPIKNALTEARTEYRNLGGHITTDLQAEHTPRYAKEKGGAIDKLLQNAKKVVKGEAGLANGGLMSKSVASGAKHRVFHVVTDENGERSVVSIKNKRVTKFNNNVLTDLGPLNSTSKASIITEKVAPIRKRLSNLDKELKTLQSVKTGTTGSEAKLAKLEDKALSISVDLMNTENAPDQIKRDQKTLRGLLHDVRLLSKVKPSESIVLRTKRIETLEKKMFEASQELLNAENEFDQSELNDRVFVDRDGKTYTLGQATTKEIEANTSTRYHKNVLANYVLAYDRQTNALSALQLLNHLQQDPVFKDLIVKQDPDQAPPDGWKDLSGVLPQFRGYYAEPKLAEALEDLATRLKGKDEWPVFDQVNNLLTSLIVMNPIMHTPNILMGAVSAKAAQGNFSLKSASNFKRAINAVKNKDELYLSYLEHGAPFMALKQTTTEFTKAVLTQYAEKLESEEEATPVSKALGYANPVAWAKGMNHLNETMTWGTNDIFFLHSILDYADQRGLEPLEAIKEVSKRMADYRIPSRLGPGKVGRALSKAAQSRFFLFSRYHYSGVIKPWVESMKDTAGPNSTWRDRRSGVRAMAYLGIMALLVYPYIDKLLRGITGDPNSYITEAGADKLIQTGEKAYAEGIQQGIPGALQSIAQLNPAIYGALELGFNTDLFTRDPIYGGNANDEGLPSWGTSMVAPLADAGRLSASDFALSLFGVYSPKNASGANNLNAMKYDELPALQVQVKKDEAAGLTEKANAEMKDFNDRAIANYNQDQLSKGLPPLTQAQLPGFLKQWGIKAPGALAMANASKLYGDGALATKQTLLQKVTKYAEAVKVDPQEVFSLIFSGQHVQKIDNFSLFGPDSTIIVVRAPLATTEPVRKSEAAANGETSQLGGLQLDHFVALSDSGTNDLYNLDLITTEQNQVLNPLAERPIAAALQNGQISKAKAIEYLTRYKIGTLGEIPSQHYLDLYKNEYGSKPITVAEIESAINNGSAK